MVAILVLFRESRVYGGLPLQGTLVVMGAVALGLALWRIGSGAIVTRLGAGLMVAISAVLVAQGWHTTALTGLIALAAGGMVAGVGGLIHGRPGRLTGLVLIALSAALVASHAANSVRGTSLALAGYALASLWLALPDLRIGRPIAGIAVAVALVGAVALWLAGNSPWTSHDGYALGCRVGSEACVATADRIAAAVRAHFAGETVISIEVLAGGRIGACWTRGGSAANGECRWGPDDGWPATMPIGSS